MKCEYPWSLPHPDGAEYGAIDGMRCRRCRACRLQRQHDFVGRALMEYAASRWSAAITLTYRDGPARNVDLAHKHLHPPHFQAFIRALRKRGHVIRYMGTGEYGKLNGRAHFHALIFGQTRQPDWPNDRLFRWDMGMIWPHGFVSTEMNPSARAMRYTLKYAMKADGGWMTLSKKPIIGHALILELAARDASLGVIPSSFEYRPPGAVPGVRYFLTGTSRREYLLELARLRGLDITALPDRGERWVRVACYKVDKWAAERREAAMPIELLEERFALEVEGKRPGRVRIEPDRDEDYWPHAGQDWTVRDTKGQNPAIIRLPPASELLQARVREDWRRNQLDGSCASPLGLGEEMPEEATDGA